MSFFINSPLFNFIHQSISFLVINPQVLLLSSVVLVIPTDINYTEIIYYSAEESTKGIWHTIFSTIYDKGSQVVNGYYTITTTTITSIGKFAGLIGVTGITVSSVFYAPQTLTFLYTNLTGFLTTAIKGCFGTIPEEALSNVSPTVATVIIVAAGGFYAIFSKLWEKHWNPLLPINPAGTSIPKTTIIPESIMTLNNSQEIVTLASNIQYLIYLTSLLTIMLILVMSWIIRTEYTKYNIRVLDPKE